MHHPCAYKYTFFLTFKTKNICVMGEMRNAYKTSVRKSEGKRLFGDLSICGRIILKWILIKQYRRI
jgi:hypothetical protein